MKMLKRGIAPFSLKHEEHFVVQPEVLSNSQHEEFVKLLDGVGWKWLGVGVFYRSGGKAFLAWQCAPK